MLLLNDISAGSNGSSLWKNVSLRVCRGEIRVINGAIGSGKTTLLRCIAGFQAVNAGNVSWDREVLSSAQYTAPPWTRNIGMAFQDSALWPHLTVEQHLLLTVKSSRRRPNKMSLTKNYVVQCLELKDYLHKKPSSLSGGQRQRVSIARAIVSQSDLLLLDEPFAHQDPDSAANVAAILHALASDFGRTLLIVSHDVRCLVPYQHTSSTLKDGTLKNDDTPFSCMRHA